MGPRNPPLEVLALAASVAIAAVTALPASAQLTYDTLYVANSRCQPPAIAIDASGVVHVVVPEEVAYRHFWRAAGVWQQELITPAINTSVVSLAVGPTDRLALLRRGAAGHLIVLRPGAQAFWDADTIPGLTTPGGSSPSLQVDPITDEPVVAFVTNSGGFFRLSLARRQLAGWSTTTVDSTPTGMGQPSLALDAVGRIRLALGRSTGPAGEEGGSYYAEAESMTGPFTWARVDTEVTASNSALVLDPVTGDPRVALGGSFGFQYASRSGDEWTSDAVDPQSSGYNSSRPLSLTLDAAGLPRILESYLLPVASVFSLAADPSCGGVSTPYPVYYARDHATGTGAFDPVFDLGNLHESGGDALATFGGQTHIVYRKSWSSTCWPAPILHAQTTSAATVPPADPRGTTLRLAPNPIRAGSALRVRLTLAADAPVTLHLTDVAGRHLAHSEHAGTRGSREIRWELPSLRAGWYRVTARQGGAPLGSGSFLVVR